VQENDHVYMILDFMEGGDLLSCITSNGYLSEAVCKLYFYQMAKGLQYLHQQGITHRDLKPDNILLKTSDTDTCVKISEFGLSKLLLLTTSMVQLVALPT
jgi:serine/threonine-protein kinase CHEK2